jgi:hypothetical protein
MPSIVFNEYGVPLHEWWARSRIRGVFCTRGRCAAGNSLGRRVPNAKSPWSPSGGPGPFAASASEGAPVISWRKHIPLPGFGNGLAVSSYLPPAAAVQTSSPARGRLSPSIYIITKPSSPSSSGYQKFRRSNNSITHTAETEERAAGPGRGPRRPRTSTVAASSSRGRTMLPGVELARRRRVHYHGDVASAAGTGEHVHHHYAHAPAPAAGPALAARIRLEEKLRGAALPSTAPSRSVASRFLFLPCFSDAWFR